MDLAVATDGRTLVIQRVSSVSPNRRFQFYKRSQLFSGTHDETLSVAMRVSNKDCSPARIHG